LKVTRCSAEHRTTSLSSWVPLSFSECIRSWQRRRPEGRRRLQPIRFLGLASTLLAEPRRLPRSRRSLGATRPKAGSADHLSQLAEASPTSDVHLSRLGRRSLLASQLPTLSPHSASTPEGASARLGRGHALSDTPHRRGHLPSRSPEGSRGSSAQTPVIVSISHCALASSSRSPLSRRLLSYDPVVRFRGACGASGSGLRPSTMLALVEVNSGEGHGKLDHIVSRRPGRAARAALVSGIRSPWERRTVVIPVVIDRCQQPTILFSRPATLRPGTLHSVFPHLAVARASRRPSQPRRSRLQSRGHCPPPQRFRAYRECFVTRGIPGRTRLVASTSVARGPPAPKRARARGSPPMV